MKTCPACNESFVDEMNFCDVDGSPLDRDAVTAGQAKNRLWSFLGVALLIGALALSVTVIFMPKPRPGPAVVRPVETPLTAAAPAQAAATDSSSKPVTNGDAEVDSTTTAASPSSELKARDRSTDPLKMTGPAPNPKAAALEAEPATAKPLEPERPITVKPDVPKTPKSVSAETDSDSPKAVRTAEAKKELPSQGPAVKTDKESKKKPDDKDKRKGGFFRVFKKIFGKD